MADAHALTTRATRALRLTRRRWPLVLGCYLALCVAYFWPSFVRGAVPLPLMNTYTQGDPVWAGYAPAATAAGSNRLLGDVTGFYYPYLVFSIENLRRGDFPLWNPDLYGGIPFFAANQAALLYPLNLVGFWFGPHWYWTITAVLRLLVAGGGMYALARRLGVSGLGALLAGGIYMFAAFQVTWLHFAVHNVAALLPLALWLIARVQESGVRSQEKEITPSPLHPFTPSPLHLLALAGVVAAQMFGGHPEMSLFFMVICGVFALVWLWPADVRRLIADRELRHTTLALVVRRVAMVGAAFALGLALSAVQWLPTLGLIRTSYTLEERGFAAANRDVAADYAPLGGLQRANWGNVRHWLLLVAPELWGSPPGDTINYWLDRTNYNEMASYVGLAALPLAALGVWRGRNWRAARFFGAMFVVSLLLLYPLPGLRLLGFVPPFSVAYGFRFGLGVTLAAALLAGLGVDVLRAANPRTLWRTAGALLALAALNFAVAYDLWGGLRVRWALGTAPSAATRTMIAAVWGAQNWRTLLPGAAGVLAAGVLALAASGALARRRALALLVALALAEITAHGYGYNGFSAPEAIYPRTAALDYLTRGQESEVRSQKSGVRSHKLGVRSQQTEGMADDEQVTPFRVLNLDGALWANSAMTHGLQVTGGLDDLVPGDQGRFVKRGMAGVVRAGDRHIVMDWGARLMELMGVRYVLADRPVLRYGARATLPLALRDHNLYVYRNDAALPRAYAATAVVQATRREAENAVFSADFDPQRAVVLEAPPAGLTPGAPTPVQPVAIVSAAPDRVELAPDLRAPAIIVLSDAYDPDWRVTVDGQAAPLLRANALFRGVVVPAGQHRVVFSYRPRLVAWGALISGAALIAATAYGIVAKRGSSRRGGS